MPGQFGNPDLYHSGISTGQHADRCKEQLTEVAEQFTEQYEACQGIYDDIQSSVVTRTISTTARSIDNEPYITLDLSQFSTVEAMHAALIDNSDFSSEPTIVGDVVFENGHLSIFTDRNIHVVGEFKDGRSCTIFSEKNIQFDATLHQVNSIQLCAENCTLDKSAHLSAAAVVCIDVAQDLKVESTVVADKIQVRAGQLEQGGLLEADSVVLAGQSIEHTGTTRARTQIKRQTLQWRASQTSCVHTPAALSSTIANCIEGGHVSCNQYQGEFSQLTFDGQFYCGSGKTQGHDLLIQADDVYETSQSCIIVNTDSLIDAKTKIDLTKGRGYTLNALRVKWKQIVDPTASYDIWNDFSKLALFRPDSLSQDLLFISSYIYEQWKPQDKHNLFLQHTHQMRSGGDIDFGGSRHTQNANTHLLAKEAIALSGDMTNATDIGQANFSMQGAAAKVSGSQLYASTTLQVRDYPQMQEDDDDQESHIVLSRAGYYVDRRSTEPQKSSKIEFELDGTLKADTILVEGKSAYMYPGSNLTTKHAKISVIDTFTIDQAEFDAKIALINAKFFYNRFSSMRGDYLIVDAATILNRGLIDYADQVYFARLFISTGVLKASNSILTNALILLRFGLIVTPYDCVTSLLNISATLNLNIGFSPNLSAFRKFMVFTNALLTLAAFTIPGAAVITEIIRIPLNTVPLLLNVIAQYPQFKAMFKNNDFDMVKTSVAIERLLMVGTSLVLSVLGGVTLFESLSPQSFAASGIPLDPANFAGIDSLESFMSCPFVKMVGQLGSALSYLSGRVSTNLIEGDFGAGLVFGDMHFDLVNVRAAVTGSVTGSNTSLIAVDYSEGLSLASTSAHGYFGWGNAGVRPLIGGNQQSFHDYTFSSDGAPLWLTHISAPNLHLATDVRLVDSSITTHNMTAGHKVRLDHSSLTAHNIVNKADLNVKNSSVVAHKLVNQGKGVVVSNASSLKVDHIENGSNKFEVNGSSVAAKSIDNNGQLTGSGNRLDAERLTNEKGATAVLYSSKVHIGRVQDDGAMQLINSQGSLGNVAVAEKALLAADGCTLSAGHVRAAEKSEVATRNSDVTYGDFNSDGDNQFSGSTVRAKLFDISKSKKTECDYSEFTLGTFKAPGQFDAQNCDIQSDQFIRPLQHDVSSVNPLSGAAGHTPIMLTAGLPNWHTDHVSLRTSDAQVSYHGTQWAVDSHHPGMSTSSEGFSTESPYELLVAADGSLIYTHEGHLIIKGEHDNYSVVGMRIRADGMKLGGRTCANANFSYESTKSLDAANVELVGGGKITLLAQGFLTARHYYIYSGGITYIIGYKGVSTQADVKNIEQDDRERSLFSSSHKHTEGTQIANDTIISKSDVIVQSSEGRADFDGTNVEAAGSVHVHGATGASVNGTAGEINQKEHRIDFLKVTNQSRHDDIYVKSNIKAGAEVTVTTDKGSVDKTGADIHAKKDVTIIAPKDNVIARQVVLEHHQSSHSFGVGARVAGIDVASVGREGNGFKEFALDVLEQDPLYASGRRLAKAQGGLESGMALLNAGMATVNTLEHAISGVEHGNLGDEALARVGLGGAKGLDPSITFTASAHSSTEHHQTVTEGGITSSEGVVRIQAGHDVTIANGEHLHANRVELSGERVTVEGAELHEQHQSMGVDVDATITLTGQVQGGGVAVNYAKGESVTHANTAIDCQKLNIETAELNMQSAVINTQSASGHIGHADIESVQDTAKGTAVSVHGNTSGLFGGSFEHRHDAVVKQQSGFNAADASKLEVGDQEIVGAHSDLSASHTSEEVLVDQVHDINVSVNVTVPTHPQATVDAPGGEPGLAHDIFRADEVSFNSTDKVVVMDNQGPRVIQDETHAIDVLVPHFNPPAHEIIDAAPVAQPALASVPTSAPTPAPTPTPTPTPAPASEHVNILPVGDDVWDARNYNSIKLDAGADGVPKEPALTAAHTSTPPLTSEHMSATVVSEQSGYISNALLGIEDGLKSLYQTIIHPIDSVVEPLAQFASDTILIYLVQENSFDLLYGATHWLTGEYHDALQRMSERGAGIYNAFDQFIHESGQQEVRDLFALGTSAAVPYAVIKAFGMLQNFNRFGSLNEPEAFSVREELGEIEYGVTWEDKQARMPKGFPLIDSSFLDRYAGDPVHFAYVATRDGSLHIATTYLSSIPLEGHTPAELFSKDFQLHGHHIENYKMRNDGTIFKVENQDSNAMLKNALFNLGSDEAYYYIVHPQGKLIEVGPDISPDIMHAYLGSVDKELEIEGDHELEEVFIVNSTDVYQANLVSHAYLATDGWAVVAGTGKFEAITNGEGVAKTYISKLDNSSGHFMPLGKKLLPLTEHAFERHGFSVRGRYEYVPESLNNPNDPRNADWVPLLEEEAVTDLKPGVAGLLGMIGYSHDSIEHDSSSDTAIINVDTRIDERDPDTTTSANVVEPSTQGYIDSMLGGVEDGAVSLYESFLVHPWDKIIKPSVELFSDLVTVYSFKECYLDAVLSTMPEFNIAYHEAEQRILAHAQGLYGAIEGFVHESGPERVHDVFALGTTFLLPAGLVGSAQILHNLSDFGVTMQPKLFSIYQDIKYIKEGITIDDLRAKIPADLKIIDHDFFEQYKGPDIDISYLITADGELRIGTTYLHPSPLEGMTPKELLLHTLLHHDGEKVYQLQTDGQLVKMEGRTVDDVMESADLNLDTDSGYRYILHPNDKIIEVAPDVSADMLRAHLAFIESELGKVSKPQLFQDKVLIIDAKGVYTPRHVKHSNLITDGWALAAGEGRLSQCKSGVCVTKLDNDSGHIIPKGKHLGGLTKHIFERNGIKVEGDFEPVSKDKFNPANNPTFEPLLTRDEPVNYKMHIAGGLGLYGGHELTQTPDNSEYKSSFSSLFVDAGKFEHAVLEGFKDGFVDLYETFIHHPVDNLLKPMAQLTIDTALIFMYKENFFNVKEAIPTLESDYHAAMWRIIEHGEGLYDSVTHLMHEPYYDQVHDMAKLAAKFAVPYGVAHGLNTLKVMRNIRDFGVRKEPPLFHNVETDFDKNLSLDIKEKMHADLFTVEQIRKREGMHIYKFAYTDDRRLIFADPNKQQSFKVMRDGEVVTKSFYPTHPSLNNSKPGYLFGEMGVNDGKLLYFNRHTGHYLVKDVTQEGHLERLGEHVFMKNGFAEAEGRFSNKITSVDIPIANRKKEPCVTQNRHHAVSPIKAGLGALLMPPGQNRGHESMHHSVDVRL